MKVAAFSDFDRWIDSLNETHDVIGPQKINGQTRYKTITHAGQIDWEFTRSITPIKEFFFSPTEHILSIVRSGQEVLLKEVLQTSPRVIVGVRPCDAHGLQVLDTVFVETAPSDVNYSAHRENTILIGLACQTAGETCFCTSMGGSPDSSENLDILLWHVDGGLIVEAVTARGEALMDTLPLDEIDLEKPTPPGMASIPLPDQVNWEKLFNLPIWEQTAERCLSCRACAYLCPTCRCFDVLDEPIPSGNGSQKFERIRVWDSCAGEAYRKIAGGHNPRKAKAERLRNRIFCKFDYFPAQYGPLACTGCGRCVEFCPVNIDITETLTQLAEVAP